MWALSGSSMRIWVTYKNMGPIWAIHGHAGRGLVWSNLRYLRIYDNVLGRNLDKFMSDKANRQLKKGTKYSAAKSLESRLKDIIDSPVGKYRKREFQRVVQATNSPGNSPAPRELFADTDNTTLALASWCHNMKSHPKQGLTRTEITSPQLLFNFSHKLCQFCNTCSFSLKILNSFRIKLEYPSV